MKKRKIRNQVTIDQLKIACRHVKELVKAGVTENLAIRTLELFADVYAKVHLGGSPTPHQVNQVPLQQWSIAARKLRDENPLANGGQHFRVEHGTPRRAFARKVMKLYDKGELNEATMNKLVRTFW